VIMKVSRILCWAINYCRFNYFRNCELCWLSFKREFPWTFKAVDKPLTHYMKILHF